jgi:hypothetical protein
MGAGLELGTYSWNHKLASIGALQDDVAYLKSQAGRVWWSPRVSSTQSLSDSPGDFKRLF